jgi:hypothetical protein
MIRLALVGVLLASTSSAALAQGAVPPGPAAVSRSFRVDFYLPGCKDFIAGRTNFDSGRCVGAVEVLDALNLDTKRFCPPAGVNNLQRIKTIVSYVEARTDRMHEDFRLVANEAMIAAWPCKK